MLQNLLRVARMKIVSNIIYIPTIIAVIVVTINNKH